MKVPALLLSVPVLVAAVSLISPSFGEQGARRVKKTTSPYSELANDPLADPSRSEDDRKRDGGFKPLEVYNFLGIEPGQIVADLWPGRGYHTQILSNIVGEKGKVLAVLGPLYYQSKYEERIRKAVGERIEAGKLENVEFVGPLSDLKDNSIDVMITVRNYHDLGEAEERTAVLPDLMRALKPGGVLGVIDAFTDKEGRDVDLHRINEKLVIREITAAGFELIEKSDVLYNADDTFEFDGREDEAPIHRYFIYRFVHRYEKPIRIGTDTHESEPAG